MKLTRYWANFFNLGLLPMRGTLATALVFVLSWVLLQWNVGYGQAILLLLILSWIATTFPASRQFSQADPLEIVADEAAAAALIALIIPHLWWWYLTAFVLFRFFDITKTFGIKQLEQLPGAVGILVDDLAAALFTVIIITIAHFWL